MSGALHAHKQPSPAGFIAEEVASAMGSYWVAIDPETGICTCGRDTRELAEADAQALNAAFEAGRQCGLLEAEE